jgi:hypothetical protein
MVIALLPDTWFNLYITAKPRFPLFNYVETSDTKRKREVGMKRVLHMCV